MARDQIIICKGAAHNDVTIKTSKGEVLYFDLSKMTRRERSNFHAQFMAAYRKANPMKPRTTPLGAAA